MKQICFGKPTVLFIAFFLLLILVGNSISFHVESKYSDISQSSSSIAQVQYETSHHSKADASDPCDQGFCHLGHCAKLIVAEFVAPVFKGEFKTQYFIRQVYFKNLVLDGIFPPPKLS
ncbi:MAG TPA: hypothetical protein VF412_11800 [Bdellovibrio sp.]|uniref:hypothetical protein n=1 Tax=Bdellovibrio sp. TaxID=28201 RepID=UPI002F12F713